MLASVGSAADVPAINGAMALQLRRSKLATDLVRQVATQARQVTVPKPDDTLVALAAATAGR